jgi:transposase InsO family protein
VGLRDAHRPQTRGLKTALTVDRRRHGLLHSTAFSSACRRVTPTGRPHDFLTHVFGMRCQENGIEHRVTKLNHPWKNGQVKRMNRTIKDATVKRYRSYDHAQLRRHLADFMDAYNFGRRLKTLRGHEFICKFWTSRA